MKETVDSVFWKRWFVLMTISIASVAFDSLGLFAWPKLAVERLLWPLQATSESAINVFTAPVRLSQQLKHSSQIQDQLQQRVSLIQIEQSHLQSLEAENQELRKLLGTPLPPEWKFLSAKILAHTPQGLIIAAGSAHGIHPGLTVVYEQHLIGKVGRVSAATSEVWLLDNHQQSIAVSTSRTPEIGVVSNQENKITLSRVEQETQIDSNQILLTAGSDGLLPGLIVGEAGAKLNQASEGYQRFEVVNTLPTKDLSQVFVVIGIGREEL